jgi:Ca2+-binding RTX toxin-like protein
MPSRKRTQFLSFLFSLTLLVFLTACDSSPGAMDEEPSVETTTEANDPGSATAKGRRIDPSQGNPRCGLPGSLLSAAPRGFLNDPSQYLADNNITGYEVWDLRYSKESLAAPASATGGLSLDEVVDRAGRDVLTVPERDMDVIIIGTEGDDNIRARRGSDCIFGLGGNDYIHGGNGEDYIRGGDGDDRLVMTGDGLPGQGGLAYIRFFGDAGDDELKIYQRGIAELHGGEGNDRLYGAAGPDYLFGGPGDDFLQSDQGPNNSNYPHGDDRMNGGAGDDVLKGGGGRDKLTGGAGADELYGGPGGDSYSGFNVDDTIDDGGTPTEGRDLLRTWEAGPRVEGPNDSPFDAFAAGIENFILNYNGGNIDASGFDQLSDEDGQALADDPNGWANNRRGFLIRLVSYANTSKGDSDAKLEFKGSRFRDLVGTVRSDTNDEIFGHGGDDRLSGGAGNDHINGGDGNDVLRGKGGDDQLWAGEGDDKVYGGDGNDIADGFRGRDLVYGGEGNDEVLHHSGPGTLYGGPGDDLLGGLGGDDTMYGEEGNDTIKGHWGDDVINGGPGTDTIDGGTEKNGTPGNDTCSDPESGSYTNCEIEDGMPV